MKRTICLVLTVMLVVTSLALVPTSASAYSPIRFKDNLKWDAFYVYQWDREGYEYSGQWPGTPLQPDETTDEYNLYTIFPTYGAEGLLVNNGEGIQSVDIMINDDVYDYTFTGKIIEDPQSRISGYEIAEITPEGNIAEPDDIKYFNISKTPDKLHYSTGDAFDPTGLEITVNYYSGDTEIIKDITPENFAEKNLALKEFNTEKTGVQLVRIAYTDKKGGEHLTSFRIKVIAKPVKIELAGMPDTNAIVGEPYLTSGLKVKATYEGGKQELIPLEYNPNAPVVWVPNFYTRTQWVNTQAVAIDENGKETIIQPSGSSTDEFGEQLLCFVFPPSATSAYFTNEDRDERTVTVTNLNTNYYQVSGKTENGEWIIYEMAPSNAYFEGFPEPAGVVTEESDDAIRSWNVYHHSAFDGYTLSKLEQKAGRQTVTVSYYGVTAAFDMDVFDRGDVNRDFSLNVVDVTAIQKSVAELTTLDDFEQQLADMNNDGACDVTDATMLQLLISET